jgi:DNA polymerase I-like protein with 3'-5' exonuclease and polymerase domains
VITEIELDEAKYNARDVLGMCRVYPHLADELDRTNTANVYEYDELMADLALQMTRVGMPVNSERRAEIGARLRALRDEAIETLRPYTEGVYRDSFLDWVASFFAVKARKGEPVAGTTRIGPTRALVEHEETRAALAEWKAYKKQLSPGDGDTAYFDELQTVEITIDELTERVKETKLVLAASQYVTDEEDGLAHTTETAYAVRHAIRRAQAIMAIDKRGVNFGAKVQQCAILRAAGVPLHRKTEKTGLPKIDKEVLESVARHPSAKALLAYILTEKTINVYIEGEKRAGKGGGKSRPVTVTEDGYIHCLWVIHKITGRWGSSPNTQNWSKRAGGGAENLRSMIEAPEGYTLIGADQKQIEARLIGGMSDCKYMKDTFRDGGDIHSAFALIGFPDVWPRLAAIFKDHKKAGKCTCVDCNTRNQMRDVTKRLEYGAFYGGKEQRLFESIVADFPDSTLGQVREFLSRFNEMLPEVLLWRKAVLDEAILQGEIRSPILGRRQVFPLGRVDPNVAYNYKAQSGAADIWAIGAAKFMQLWDQEEYDARLINNSHDSVLILVREDLAQQVEQDVYACWNMVWNDVPFEMESKIAKQWSET